MARVFHPLFRMLANSTQRELAAQVRYLKEENRVLRSRLGSKITVTPRERRRLVQLGRRIGPAMKDLITVVGYRTWQRWVAVAKASFTLS